MTEQMKALLVALNAAKDNISFGTTEAGINFKEYDAEDPEKVTKRYFIKLRPVMVGDVEELKFVAREHRA